MINSKYKKDESGRIGYRNWYSHCAVCNTVHRRYKLVPRFDYAATGLLSSSCNSRNSYPLVSPHFASSEINTININMYNVPSKDYNFLTKFFSNYNFSINIAYSRFLPHTPPINLNPHHTIHTFRKILSQICSSFKSFLKTVF